MTISVRVRARAHGAIVTVKTTTEGEEGHNLEEEVTTLGNFEEQEFHVEEGQSLTTVEGSPDLIEELEAKADAEVGAPLPRETREINPGEVAPMSEVLDQDQDGHADTSGKFVSPNPGRRGRGNTEGAGV